MASEKKIRSESVQGQGKETWKVYNNCRFRQYEDFIVNTLFQKMISQIDFNNNIFQVLAVGAGDGCFDIVILDEFVKSTGNKPLKIIYTIVEPNVLTLEEFKGKIKQRNEYFSGAVEFRWINQTFEEFITDCKSSSNNEKYDLVHFISCLYYMDENFVMKETAKLLNQGGQIVVAVGLDGDLWSEMFRKFKSKITSQIAERRYVTSEDVIKVSKRHGFEWEVLEAEVTVDVTEMWVENSAIGQAMLQFFLHCKEDPRKALSPEFIEEFMNFLKGHRYNVIVNGENKYVVKESIAYVILRK